MSAKEGQFDLIDFLQFMQEAIAKIRASTECMTKNEFLAETPSSSIVRDAVVYNIGVIGEVANDILEHHSDFATANPQIPFRRIKNMRNQMYHGYHSINYDTVWTTATTHVLALEAQILACLEVIKPADRPPTPFD